MSSRLVARQLRAILAEGPPPLGASRYLHLSPALVIPLIMTPPLSEPSGTGYPLPNPRVVLSSRIWSTTLFSGLGFWQACQGLARWTMNKREKFGSNFIHTMTKDDDNHFHDDDGGDDCHDDWILGERTGRDCDGAAQVKPFIILKMKQLFPPFFIKQVKQWLSVSQSMIFSAWSIWSVRSVKPSLTETQ